jgi:CheY-like chemotaxis protein
MTNKGDLVRRVLVVDDEPQICNSIKEYLDKTGYECITCSNGYSALKQVIENPNFDFGLIDVNMPRMDGMELAKHFQKLYPHIPKIMISGIDLKVNYTDLIQDTLTLSKQCGIEEFIPKPFSFKIMEEKIKKIKEKTRSNNFHPFEENQNVVIYSKNINLIKKIKIELQSESFLVNGTSSENYLKTILNNTKIQNVIIDYSKKGFGSIEKHEDFLNKIENLSEMIRGINEYTNIIGTGIEGVFAEDIIQIEPLGSFKLDEKSGMEKLNNLLKKGTNKFYRNQKSSIRLNSFESFKDNYNPNANIWFFYGGSATGKTTTSFEVSKKLLNEKKIETKVLQIYTNRDQRKIEKKIEKKLGENNLDRICIDKDSFQKKKNYKKDYYYFKASSENEYLIPIKKLKTYLKKGYKVLINLTTESAYEGFKVNQKELLKEYGFNKALFLSDQKRLYNRFINREDMTIEEIKNQSAILDRLEGELDRNVKKINDFTVVLVNNLPFSPDVKLNLYGINKQLFDENIQEGFKARSQYLTDLISK